MHADHKPIEGFPGYFIDRAGHVFSTRSGGYRQMKSIWPNSHGYLGIKLRMASGTFKHLRIHREVARAFLPPQPSLRHEIRHLDGNRRNPHADNLKWGTRSDNIADCKAHGNQPHGPAHSEAIKAGLARSIELKRKSAERMITATDKAA